MKSVLCLCRFEPVHLLAREDGRTPALPSSSTRTKPRSYQQEQQGSQNEQNERRSTKQQSLLSTNAIRNNPLCTSLQHTLYTTT